MNSKKNKNILYVDITQLVFWPGELTGIPRVMHEYFIRFAKIDNAKFVIWNKQKSAYSELDKDQAIKSSGRKLYYTQTKSSSFIEVLYEGISFCLKKAALLLNKQKLILLAHKIPRYTTLVAKAVTVKHGDKMVVLWGEQGNKLFINYLIKLKSIGVEIYQVSYDMLPIICPHFSGHSTEAMYNYSKNIFPICKKIIAISANTKKDIITWMTSKNLRIPNIEVIRFGDDFTTPSQGNLNVSEKVQPILKKEFILCVGTIEARKNHFLLYNVRKLALEKGIDLPPIVIVGRIGYRAKDLYEIISNDPQVNDEFIFLTDINDQDLEELYKASLFTIYPSFYEGWGLPVAESLFYKKPIIASRSSSITEIAGNIIEYFSPYSADECLILIKKYLDKQYLKSVENKILNKYHVRTWDDSFKSFANLIGVGQTEL